MRWLLGVAVLLGLIVHTTWAQAPKFALGIKFIADC